MEPTGRSAPSMGRMMAIGIVVSALAAAGAGFAGGYLAQSAPPVQVREFYVFSSILPFNETIVGLPPDIFVPDRIVVHKGDSVTIRFYNTADPSELHAFTMDAPLR